MGGSSSQQQPTQTTTTQISPEAQALFGLAYPSIANFAASPPPARYPGSTVAGFDPMQMAAQDVALGAAGAQAGEAQRASSLASSIPGMLQWGSPTSATPYTPPNWAPSDIPLSSNIFSDPGIWNPQYNAGLQSAIEAAQRPTWQGLTEAALPAIRDTAISTGPFGGSRQGIAEGLATSRATQTAADIASKMTADVYGQNLAAVNNRYNTNIQAIMQKYGVDANTAVAIAGQGLTARGQDISGEGQRYGQNLSALYQTLGLTPTLQGAWATPASTIGAVGDVRQGMTQAQLSDAINAWNYAELAPFLQSKEILSLIQGLPGASTISTANVPQASPGMQAVGSALSGAAIGSTFGLPGAAIGAGAGALLPFLFG